MAKKPPSPAQLAHRLTWQLKGYLKRIELAYIRAAIQLAKIRDEEHWKALRHPSIEDYAQKRLGLQRSSLYHYLQVHKWLKRDHPAWLAPKPKGFIPALTGASALMWIENYLHDGRPSDSARKDLKAMRQQALRGTLTDDEFRALRARVRGTVAPLRGMLRRMKSLRREADRVPRFPAAARAARRSDSRARADARFESGDREAAEPAANHARATRARAWFRDRLIRELEKSRAPGLELGNPHGERVSGRERYTLPVAIELFRLAPSLSSGPGRAKPGSR